MYTQVHTISWVMVVHLKNRTCSKDCFQRKVVHLSQEVSSWKGLCFKYIKAIPAWPFAIMSLISVVNGAYIQWTAFWKAPFFSVIIYSGKIHILYYSFYKGWERGVYKVHSDVVIRKITDGKECRWTCK